MNRTCELNTGYFALAFPRNGTLNFVINSDKFFDRASAELFLSDRIANGEAFDYERVVEVWVNLQWFGEATVTGDKGENAGVHGWLFPMPELKYRLIDDGTLDTVIEVNGKQYRFSQEYAAEFRNANTGAMTKGGLEALAEECLEQAELDGERQGE